MFFFIGTDFTCHTHTLSQYLYEVVVAFINLLAQLIQVLGALIRFADDEQVQYVVQNVGSYLLGCITPSTIGIAMALHDKSVKAQVHSLLAKRGYVDDSYADAMVEREKLVSTYMGMGVAIPHGTSQKKGTVKKSGVVLLQYPQGVDFGDEKAYLVFGIAGVGNDHLDLLGNVCEILEDEDALEQLKTTSDMNYVLEHLQ